MNPIDKKKHWETIYSTKQLKEVSWHQPKPEISLNIIKELNIPKTASIIDIGGGDSLLVDNLLNQGYKNITVLDISKKAIERAKLRLGKLEKIVKWIEADVSNFDPKDTYDLWHDRATFHFLTKEQEITNYVISAKKGIIDSGYLIVGTFSEKGPDKCSGLEITQYSEKKLTQKFKASFKKITCQFVEHLTPFNTTQDFIFCSFKKIINV